MLRLNDNEGYLIDPNALESVYCGAQQFETCEEIPQEPATGWVWLPKPKKFKTATCYRINLNFRSGDKQTCWYGVNAELRNKDYILIFKATQTTVEFDPQPAAPNV